MAGKYTDRHRFQLRKSNANVTPIIKWQESLGREGDILLVSKQASEAKHGVTATLQYYSTRFPEFSLKETIDLRIKKPTPVAAILDSPTLFCIHSNHESSIQPQVRIFHFRYLSAYRHRDTLNRF